MFSITLLQEGKKKGKLNKMDFQRSFTRFVLSNQSQIARTDGNLFPIDQNYLRDPSKGVKQKQILPVLQQKKRLHCTDLGSKEIVFISVMLKSVELHYAIIPSVKGISPFPTCSTSCIKSSSSGT